ncbi:MAG: 3-hydroxyacyl-CoA dehydrogenase family protein [Pseudomonadota bacterium]
MSAAVSPLQDAFWQACEQMLMDHTTPWDLDEALVAWGYGIGPCEVQDLVGLDVVLNHRAGSAPAPILARMVSEGRLGKKFGWGYYRYPGGGGAVIDPLIDDLICEEAHFARRTREELEGEVLVARLHGVIGPALRADPDGAVAFLHAPQHRLHLL